MDGDREEEGGKGRILIIWGKVAQITLPPHPSLQVASPSPPPQIFGVGEGKGCCLPRRGGLGEVASLPYPNMRQLGGKGWGGRGGLLLFGFFPQPSPLPPLPPSCLTPSPFGVGGGKGVGVLLTPPSCFGQGRAGESCLRILGKQHPLPLWGGEEGGGEGVIWEDYWWRVRRRSGVRGELGMMEVELVQVFLFIAIVFLNQMYYH